MHNVSGCVKLGCVKLNRGWYPYANQDDFFLLLVRFLDVLSPVFPFFFVGWSNLWARDGRKAPRWWRQSWYIRPWVAESRYIACESFPSRSHISHKYERESIIHLFSIRLKNIEHFLKHIRWTSKCNWSHYGDYSSTIRTIKCQSTLINFLDMKIKHNIV